MKKFLIIFVIAFFIFNLFWVDFCFALNAPTTPKSIPNEDIGTASVILNWTWSGGTGTIKQFKILYKDEASVNWYPKYPQIHEPPEGNYSYSLKGLADGTDYQWKIKAEAQDSSNDSPYKDGPGFTTKESKPGCPAPYTCKERKDCDKCQDDFTCPQESQCCCKTEGDGGEPSEPSPTQPLVNPLLVDTLCDLLDKLINFLFMLALGIAPIVAIVAGIYMLSGEPEKVKRAKQILLWAAIALTIVFLAKGLPAIIKGALGG